MIAQHCNILEAWLNSDSVTAVPPDPEGSDSVETKERAIRSALLEKMHEKLMSVRDVFDEIAHRHQGHITQAALRTYSHRLHIDLDGAEVVKLVRKYGKQDEDQLNFKDFMAFIQHGPSPNVDLDASIGSIGGLSLSSGISTTSSESTQRREVKAIQKLASKAPHVERYARLYGMGGFLRLNELRMVVNRLAPSVVLSEKEFGALFSKYDPNNTGKFPVGMLLDDLEDAASPVTVPRTPLELGEGDLALRSLIATKLFERRSHLSEAFMQLDKDHSGSLSRSELSDGLRSLGVVLAPGEIDLLFMHALWHQGGDRMNYQAFLRFIGAQPSASLLSPSIAPKFGVTLLGSILGKIDEQESTFLEACKARDQEPMGQLWFDDFLSALRDSDISLSRQELEYVCVHFDRRRSGLVDYGLLLATLEDERKRPDANVVAKKFSDTVALDKIIAKALLPYHDKLVENFVAADDNGDGEIWHGQLRAVLRQVVARGVLGTAEIKRIIDVCDPSSSGRVNWLDLMVMVTLPESGERRPMITTDLSASGLL